MYYIADDTRIFSDYKALAGTAITFRGFSFMRHKERILPDGYRELSVVYLDEIKVRTTGVYLLWFGDYFYIGKAKDIRARVSHHRSVISTCLGMALFGRKSKSHYGSYEFIVRHLIENKHITDIEVSLLDICETEEEALREESFWHKVLISHDLNFRCLNKLYYVPNFLF